MSEAERYEELEQLLTANLPDVRSLGLSMVDPIWARRTHPSVHSEIYHIVEGHVDVVCGRSHYRAGPGDTVLIPPGTPHRDEFDTTEGLKILMAQFTWDAEKDYFSVIRWPVPRDISDDAKLQIRHLLELIHEEFRSEMFGGNLVSSAHLLSVLLILLQETMPSSIRKRRHQRPKQPPQHNLMLQAKAYLKENYNRPIRLDDIAAALGVSPGHLSHVFSRESDFSLFSYLTNLRMKKARLLLRENRLKIRAVAQEVGYDSSNYFAKVFRKHFGVSPSEMAAGKSK